MINRRAQLINPWQSCREASHVVAFHLASRLEPAAADAIARRENRGGKRLLAVLQGEGAVRGEVELLYIACVVDCDQAGDEAGFASC